MLWADVKQHFSFPENKEEIFQDWVMKKIAISFQTFQKNLNKDYIKKGRVTDFEKQFKKQCPFWDAFVQYKLSETSEKRTAQAKEKQEGTLSSSWARRLFDGDPQMAENGRRPHCKGNHTGDFRLATVSKAFLLRSWRLPKLGRWIAYY